MTLVKKFEFGLTMNNRKIKKASELIKSGEITAAKELYLDIKKHTKIDSLAYRNSIDFMLNKLSNDREINNRIVDESSLPLKVSRNNIILLINPSHAHKLEVEFWEQYGKKAIDEGFQVVELAFRNVEPFSTNITIVNPARAVDLARKYLNFDSRDTPKWFSNNLLEHYSDWEHRRWQLDKYNANVKLGISRTAKFIDEFIKELNPQMIITTNKIDWPNNFGYRAAKHYGIDYFFFERSPLDSHLIERNGMFAESILSERLIFDRNLEASRFSSSRAESLIEKLTANPYGYRAEEAVKNTLPQIDKSKKTFFLPLDNIIWTGWGMNLVEQGRIDYPIYSTPIEALKRITSEVENLGGQLIVKPHPSCKEWPLIANNVPNAIFCDSDLLDLLQISDVVITFLTKVTYVALAFNKPVVSFGGGLLDGFGVTYQVSSDSELKWKLNDALNRVRLNDNLVRFKNILPALDDTFFNDGCLAFEYMNSSLKNIKTIQVNNLIEKCKRIQSTKTVDKLIKNNILIDDYKPTVLFDVSRLTAGGMWNSGISRYARAVIRGLKKSRLFNVICGANYAKNEFGLSSFYIKKLQDELNVVVVDIKQAFNYLDNKGDKYIYHTPINPDQLELKHVNAIKVITVHDILHVTQSEFYNSSNTITPRIINAIDHDVTGVIFDSQYSQLDFERYTGKKVINSTVIHLGVDEPFLSDNDCLISDEFKSHFKSNVINLVIPFQGDPRKGFKRMLEIAKSWQDGALNERRVIIFGSHRNKSRYEEVAQELFIDSKNNQGFIYFHDCNDDELAYIYRNSIAHLYLSEAEGFGLPPLEAMSCGCPSIVLSNTSLSEVYDGWPLCLENNATNDNVLNVLSELSLNKKYLSRLKYEAIIFSNKYKWDLTVDSSIKFYQKLLSI